MDDEFDLKFVPELDIFDVVPDDDIFILEPVPLKEPKRIIKNKTEVRVPVYAKKKFNSNPTRISRFITAVTSRPRNTSRFGETRSPI